MTGANKGVGQATALSLAKAGAEGIVIAARKDLKSVEGAVRRAAKEAGRPEPKILILKLDVTSREDVEEAAKQVESTFGRLDILINNAGYLEEYHNIAETDPYDWWYSVEVNVKGTYLMSRSFIPILLKGGDKTIVNLSSIGAHIIGPGGSAYVLSKTAILRFGEFVSAEYGDQGLVAFGVHPGGIQTELGLKFMKTSNSGIRKSWQALHKCEIFANSGRIGRDGRACRRHNSASVVAEV